MCGICGVVCFDGRPGDGAIRAGLAALRHRGPDANGTYSLQQERISVHYAAARLAVLDPRAAAHQPLRRPDQCVLVFNGEVYNFRQIRAELEALGERFVTEGDTEVVAAVCARWGIDGLHRLDGMWALAFYDAKSQFGFIARDPLGIKPLFYAVSGRELLFASELKALTCLGSWRREIDAGAVVQHLVFGYIAAPATIYRAAWRLAPGHCLTFGPEGLGEPQNYRPQAQPHGSDKPNYNEARPRIRRLIGDAVARQRVSDVPLGAFLSGGLDSSIVVAHLAESTPGPVHTFCVGYEKAPGFDERYFASLVAQRFSTRHEEVVLTEAEVIKAIPRILDHLGEPVGDSSIIPTSIVSHAARQFVTVALSGDGGDEIFGGYWRYLAQDAWTAYHRIPRLMRKGLIEPLLSLFAISRSSRGGNRARQFRKLMRTQSTDPLDRHIAWSRILGDDAAHLFTDPALVLRAVQSMRARATEITQVAAQETDPLGRILCFDLAHQLPSDMLHKVDLASMMHSLEVRVPLLDLAVVEAAAAMPSSFKIRRGIRKRILLDAYRGLLPDEVLDRPKQGFEVPVGDLLRGPLRSLFHDIVRKDRVDSFGLISHPAVESIYSEHVERRSDHSDLLWAILSLCWWSAKAGT